MSKHRKRLSTKSLESILRVRNYREILPDIYYEQTQELFLTEYLNGEMRSGKRRPAGYVTSSKAIVQAKKKRGLTLTTKYSNDEMNEDETAPKVIPGEDQLFVRRFKE